MIDTAITNCRIIEPAGIYKAGIGIDGGKIVAVTSDSNLPAAERVIDAKDNFVCPGIIDPHQHYASVTHDFQNDIKTETRAAAYGGVTTVMTTIRPVFLGGEYLDVFDRVRTWVDTGATVNVAFSIDIMKEEHARNIPEYARRLGITSFKARLGYKGAQAEKMNSVSVDDGIIYTGFRQVKKAGPPAMVMVHCENADVIAVLQRDLMEQGRTDLPAYTESRPGFCEAESMTRMMYLAGVAKSRLYIPHITIAEGIDAVANAKARGVNVMAETCPQYLTLTKDCGKGPLGVVNPPLREKSDVARLWAAINEGVVDCMGTDHVIRFKKLKESIWDNMPGFPGVQTFIPVMLSEGVNKGRLSLERFVAICSYNTARIFGLYPRKGTIRVGADADLDIIDLKKEKKLTFDEIASGGGASDFSLYDGWTFRGFPVMAMVAGKVVMQEGTVLGAPGDGRYIPRSTLAPDGQEEEIAPQTAPAQLTAHS